MKEILEAHKLWLETNGRDGERADLRGADLRGADLRGADLSGADLRWADLSGADLRGVDLSGADLRGAELRGVELRLSVQNPDPDLIKKVAEAALSGNLDMDTWHSECGTAHCIAGWAVTLHPEGKGLEEKSSSYLAGRLLLGDEAAEHFFDDNETALEWLKTKL